MHPEPEPQHTPFHIVEVDDDGWAAFKALEAQHRREYAASPEAVADHEAWVNSPMPKEPRWQSIPPEEQAALKWPKIIPSPTQLPWEELYDWSQKNREVGNLENTLARKLGTTTHKSLLLYELAQMGMDSPTKLVEEAIARGCSHYRINPDKSYEINFPEASNEKIAMALLSPCNSYEPQWLRIGAQLLSHPSNNPKQLARISIKDRSASVLKYIAQCGRQTEPENPFWQEIINQLQNYQPGPANVISHISRFRIETGITDPRTPATPKIIWLRPNRKVNHE